ncbi:MAG: hypothetical protein V4694_05765 [Pseudomonadota bacterium]
MDWVTNPVQRRSSEGANGTFINTSINNINRSMLPKKILFEIPIYRLSPTEYGHQLENYIEENSKNVHPDLTTTPRFRDSLWKRFGGDWKYNEIIGYIRLYINDEIDTRILGEQWWSNSKVKKRKTRKKIFEYFYHKSGFEIHRNDYYNKSNEVIFKLLSNTISRLKEDSDYRKYYIEDSLFLSVGKFIDWNGLLNS